MQKVQPTTTITVDGAAYSVDKMSDNIKQMVAFMDDWRQREADLQGELTMVGSALRDVKNTIYVAINKERQEAMAKAKAMGLVPDEQSAKTPPPPPGAEKADEDAEFAEVKTDQPAGE